MADKVGKEFEERTKTSWESSLPGTFFSRLPDQQSKYKGTSANICDYVGFTNGKLFLIECKTTKEGTLNIKSDFKQYHILKDYVNIKGLHAGVLIWYYSYNVIVWVPIEEVNKMVSDGKKSISKKELLKGEYKCVFIPFRIPRVYPKMDFNVLNDIE